MVWHHFSNVGWGWKPTEQTIKATLYVRELANQLIYRIGYNAAYYAVMTYEAKPKYVIIDEQRYEFGEGPNN